MPIALLVFLGAGCGGVLRWLAAGLIDRLVPGSVVGFPLGILVVNILGSLLFGLVAGAWRETWWVGPLVLTGLLGGFTTFSAFSMQVVELAGIGRWALALGYILISVLTCVLAAGLGLALTRGG